MRPHLRPLVTCSYCLHWEAPLLKCVLLASNFFLCFWHIPNSQTGTLFFWWWRRRSDSFSLPHPFRFAQIYELFWEELSWHVSQALSIRLTDKQAGPWHWTVSFCQCSYIQKESWGSRISLTHGMFFLKNALWFLNRGRKELVQNKGRKNLLFLSMKPTSWFLLPRM